MERMRAAKKAVVKFFKPTSKQCEQQQDDTGVHPTFPFTQVTLVETDDCYNMRTSSLKSESKRKRRLVYAMMHTSSGVNVIGHELIATTSHLKLQKLSHKDPIKLGRMCTLEVVGFCFIDIAMPCGRLFQRQFFYVVKNYFGFVVHLGNEFLDKFQRLTFCLNGITSKHLCITAFKMDSGLTVTSRTELLEDYVCGSPCVDVKIRERLFPDVLVNTGSTRSIMDDHLARTHLAAG